MKKIKLATVFSGIGAVEFAFRRLGINHEIVFACDNGERDVTYNLEEEKNNVKKLNGPIEKRNYVDSLYESLTRKHNFVKDSYMANYQIKNDMYFQDICLLDGIDFKNKVDILVGGSPCQSFSQVGSQKGLEDTRGTLFYEYARLIKEIRPKVFIYENVRNMLSHNNGETWNTIKSVFESLEYNIDFKILNAVDFNIPQKRSRLFLVGYRKDQNVIPNIVEKKAGIEECEYKMQDFLVSNNSYGNFTYDKSNGELIVKHDKGDAVLDRYFLSEAIERYVMKEGTKNWHQKVEIDLKVARTLLKTMGNNHRAGVDNYVTENGKIRMLTEREAHRLMGFTDDYKIVVSKSQAYKQAGNSIVVDVLMSIVKTILADIFGE